MKYNEILNKEQFEAVTYVNGPLLILAGAGSGKTTVLTYRVAYMIQNANIPYYNILAITFTNKAALEMRTRILNLIGQDASGMWISTFHRACVRILRRESDKLGFNKNFTIYDSYDSKSLIADCMKDLNINEKDLPVKQLVNKISNLKDDLVSPEEFLNRAGTNKIDTIYANVYTLYQKRLKEFNAMDFDDLIFMTVKLFKKDQEVLNFYRRKFKYIMVDEYQDTNKAQYELIHLLAKEHKNICAVGDDDQCIYEWRGANISNILNFENDYENCKVVRLETNYRSYKNILDAANSVIKNNEQRKGKKLRTDKESGDKIKYYAAFSEEDEASFVVSEIEKIMRDQNKTYKDFAVLYRTNAQSRIFESSMVKWGMPYKIVGGLKFYDRKEIKDILAYLKVIANPLDNLSIIRIINVPKRSIGNITIKKIAEYAEYIEENIYPTLLDIGPLGLPAKTKSALDKFTGLLNNFIRKKNSLKAHELIKEVLEATGYLRELENSKSMEDKSRLENINELISAAVQFENLNEDNSIDAFLESVTLVSDADNYDETSDVVTLMTLHSAKGLEFPVVFMVGMENGLFPGSQSLEKKKEMEESRRLCYVGITRAKERLYLTRAENRMYFGYRESFSPSIFLSEISGELIDDLNGIPKPHKVLNSVKHGNLNSLKNFSFLESVVTTDENIERNSPKDFISGRKVFHDKFKEGTIVSVSGEDDEKKITVAFDNMGIKILAIKTAPIKLI